MDIIESVLMEALVELELEAMVEGAIAPTVEAMVPAEVIEIDR